MTLGTPIGSCGGAFFSPPRAFRRLQQNLFFSGAVARVRDVADIELEPLDAGGGGYATQQCEAAAEICTCRRPGPGERGGGGEGMGSQDAEAHTQFNTFCPQSFLPASAPMRTLPFVGARSAASYYCASMPG